jgi:hypothetical protein
MAKRILRRVAAALATLTALFLSAGAASRWY